MSASAASRGRLVAIVGPTASGKTALAVRLGELVGGEIVSADSQQVYRGMDIGTGKATAEERARVPHHLLDVVDPDQEMTAARFVELADAALADIAARGRPAIVAGGTGLYYRALVRGLFAGPGADPGLRARLEDEANRLGALALWRRLAELDAPAAARIDPHDRRRIIRALEVQSLTGVPMSEHQRAHDYRAAPLRYQVRAVGLSPPRPELYRRIDERVDRMMASGLVDEVRALQARGYGCDLRALGAIGYRETCAHLRGELTLAEAAAAIKSATHRYARRQLAWFRSEPEVVFRETAHAGDVDLADLAAWLRSG